MSKALPFNNHVCLLGFAFLLQTACAAEGEGQGQRPDARVTDASPGQSDFSVLFKTSAGDFTVDVTRSWSPNGADRFRELVEDKFYDDTRFFRVVSGFVVQFGISGSPAVNMTWNSMTIPDDPVMRSNARGYVTFAAGTDPNSRTTQLFINYIDNGFLDSSGFSPIGVIRGSGMQSVDAINSEYAERPQQPDIQLLGNDYLDTQFPRLDKIITATIQ
ncbi:MAG: peptidylprolyl isomerase [Kofleriaceae bacterium]|nr:peptidylprolyl isomerase [Kofleriaceae bacterium]